jgi:uncharacterized SAM-binding protein YcdF (DUF218 family)
MTPILILFSIWRLIAGCRAGGKRGRILNLAAAVGLLLWCWPVTAWLFVRTLEGGSPLQPTPSRPTDAIVVLSSGTYFANASHPEPEEGFETFLRSSHAALYFHRHPQPVVVSGGAVDTGDPAPADLMRLHLLRRGVPDSMITVENRSRTTYENALDTARILLPKGIRRIALVTEGFHMTRARLCFRKQGFDVIAEACCYRTLEPRTVSDLLVPSIWAIKVNQAVVHEWSGLAWYRIRGRI